MQLLEQRSNVTKDIMVCNKVWVKDKSEMDEEDK